MKIRTQIYRREQLLSNIPGLESFEQRSVETGPGERANLEVILNFTDGRRLRIHEIVDTTPCYPRWIKYSYQYMQQDDTLVFRYDNAHSHSKHGDMPPHRHGRLDKPNPPPPHPRPKLNEVIAEARKNIDWEIVAQAIIDTS